MTSPAIHIRPLDRTEWAVFKNIRLLALQTEPGVFSASYESWETKSPDEWQNLLAGTGHQAFGLFEGIRLIGITGVVTSREDGRTAILVMSFILPEYREQGLSRFLYDVRLQWIRSRPEFTKVIVSHRESNEASRKANQRHGFQIVKREARKWPDGITEDEIFYELCLVPNLHSD